ncbi:multidrug resistance protein B [Salmonella enterica subsp. enterica]|uniref:Multidrug resistance protein B n=1 Tax=Salmonella enterica I TaxID=59201 RepID=A0A379WN28_SALET|nr:multidrug resistance protein B [Salmonella enterica subsp. enterica]
MQQQKPLEGAQLVIMTIALSLATFMQVLDSTIANVAIPTIAGNLGSSLSQGTWVITSFGVANAISIPLTGWLAKRLAKSNCSCGRRSPLPRPPGPVAYPAA